MKEIVDTLLKLIKNNDDVNHICSNIVKDLNNGKISMLDLVENMKDLLMNSDIVLRRGGTEVLSSVLTELPQHFLTFKEITVLVNFYCDRLLDHHSIIPAILMGFLALAKMEHLPDGMAAKIFTSMNLNFVCQSQTQADRFMCYQVYNTMMHKKSAELQALGPDFVCGYLQTIDSERDPRNLIYLFTNLPYFYKNFPLGHLTEDAFEAASCYFPVDFRANPKDPRGISREDLSNTLLPCLTAVNEFMPFTVELALDKLSSDLKLAKIDSLILLRECFKTFPSEELCSQLNEIVSAILNELKPGLAVDSSVQEEAVQTLVSVIKYLSNNDRSEDLTTTLNTIFSGIQHFLNDIHLNLFYSVIKFVSTLSYGCRTASQFFAAKVIPKLIPSSEASSSDLIIILRSVKSLLESCVFFNINCAEELCDVWDKVTKLFIKNCESKSSELKIVAIENTSGIVKLLSNEQRDSLYTILCKNILSETDSISGRKYMNCVKKIAEIYPEEIQRVVKIEFDDPGGCKNSTTKQERIFQCICTLSPINGFLQYMDEAVRIYISNDSFQFTNFVIRSLKDLVISEKNNRSFLHALHHQMNLTRRLIDWWHKGCNAIADDSNFTFDDEEVAKNLQLIIFTIVRELEKKNQNEMADSYIQLTLDYSTRFMNSFVYLNDNDDLSTPKVHCSLSIITFESIVSGLLQDVLEERLSCYLVQIIKYLTTLAIYCSRPVCCYVACRSIAVIFNKLIEGVNLENQSKYVFSCISSILTNKPVSLKANAVNLLIYTTKSLLLRGFADLNPWLDKLLGTITEEDVGHLVADGFRIILKEDEYFLNESCHCTVKLFYRQRLFSYMIPKLVELAKSSETSNKKKCAVSALHLLKDLPQSVIDRYFKKIVPLIVEVLNSADDSDLTYIAVEKLTTMLNENPTSFETHIETFVPKLLLLACEGSQMKVRVVALQCLYNYSKLNVTSILPFKTKVLFELAPCLDDKKRLVRKQAAKTRARWFVIGTS